MEFLARRRSLEDLTVGPVLTITTSGNAPPHLETASQDARELRCGRISTHSRGGGTTRAMIHYTTAMQGHVQQLLSIPGAELLWGGGELPNHCIPAKFGALEPTAVFVPLVELVKPQHFELCTSEIFGPLQVRRVQAKVEAGRFHDGDGAQCMRRGFIHPSIRQDHRRVSFSE